MDDFIIPEYSKHSAMMSRMIGIYSAYSGFGTNSFIQTQLNGRWNEKPVQDFQ